ncbi:histone deacetylase family protein [Geopsychrobacter electrodiphilus]|uniref:histone deacetylase family protein n=1 Tax=Geopsychrobacter electrodiphilus TaxID=225196 RepID=UPI0003680F05|nr:histone deacetylase [Geopsychrobacter electrodiphilus]
MKELAARFPFRREYFQLFSHPDCLLHQVGEDHPETAGRLRQVLRGCSALAASLPISVQIPPLARVFQLEQIHEKDYLMRLKIACLRSQPYFMSPDNHISPQTFKAVLAAGGCSLALAATLLEQGAGFALVRPPGHHAGRNRAEGFCFVNHAALVIETIRRQQPQACFLVVDFDVHHGNGFNFLYYDDPRIFYYSLHGSPEHIFPNTGHGHESGYGPGSGCTCNITLPLECSGDQWLQQFSENLRNFERKIRPDYLLVNAGFDAHREDPFGVMNVEDRHFLAAVNQLQMLAREYCAGKIGLFLEGGYSLEVLERLVPQIIAELALAQRQS